MPHSSRLNVLRLVSFAWLALCFAGPAIRLQGAGDSDLPAAYASRLAPLLTPVEQVLALPTSTARPDDSGVTLLDERIVSVDAKGRKVQVWQSAYKTLTDAAVKSNGEDVFTFRKREQKIHLVLAETIQPDGQRQPVAPEAVLIQSPQRQAEYSLYDDQSEMKIIFPSVRPGSVTHVIVVIEDLVAKFPGEFAHRFVWGGTWAKERMRYHLELPQEMAARLKYETLGSGVPAPTIEKKPGDRVMYHWSLDRVHGQHYEIDPAPPDQIGPAIGLTSLKSWDDVARWYNTLLRDHDQIGPDLAKNADEWTASAKSRADIIAQLHAKIADDVRYVGLEFGAADYQPHRCDDVWNNRYGDCKDKANLLAALLRRRGIDACTVLVNTDYLGLVDRRTPDFHVLNHAIVAIPEPNGGYLFCDPTIAFSVPGLLGPGSVDRDVLVITPTGAKWVHTPPASAGTLCYAFDLKLAADGGLSGWLTMTSDGYYGASERHRFLRLNAQETRTSVGDTVRGFYDGAEVIDAQRVESPRGQPFVIRAYFTVPGAAKPQDGKQTVVFPSASGLFPRVGDETERQTTFSLTPDRVVVSAEIKLPGDLAPEQTAPDFQFSSRAMDVSASWTFAPLVCRTKLDLATKSSTVTRDEFAGFYRSIRAAEAWVARPMVLHAGSVAVAAAKDVPELDFPLMPTGDGQLDLVDKRYPEKGDLELRRRALERTIQYFPKETDIVFRANAMIAVMDWNADRNDAAHQRLAPLLRDNAGRIDAETFAWAETVEALALRDLHHEDEALRYFQRLAHDTHLSGDRRARNAVFAAGLLEPKAPADALALLLEVAAAPDGATAGVETKIAQLYLNSGGVPDLRTHLRKIVETRPDSCDEELTHILETAQGWPNRLGPRLQQLVDVVRSVRPKPADALAKALGTAGTRAAFLTVYLGLTHLVENPPFSEWVLKEEPLDTFDAYTTAISDAAKKKDAARSFRICLAAALQSNINEDFPHRLWRAANYADWVQRQGTTPIDPTVTDGLLDLCDQLPKNHDYYFEGRLLRADRVKITAGPAAEIALLREVLAGKELTDDYLLVTSRRLAEELITCEHDLKGALKLYRAVEPLAKTFYKAPDSVLREVLIDLQLGDDDDALRCIAVLRTVPADTLKECPTRELIAELLALEKTGRAREVWQAGRAWWPQWRHFASPLIGTNDTADEIMPAIESLAELRTALGDAQHAGERKAYFETLDKLFSAARWFPSLASEIGSLYSTAAEFAPERAAELRKVTIAALECPHPPEIGKLSARELQLAIHYFDGGQPADTLKVVARFEARHPPLDATVHAMRRLRGIAALAVGQETAPAATALESSLADPSFSDQRADSVKILSELYRTLGRKQDAERLLQKELANPAITANQAATELIRSQLKQLTGEATFNRQIESWRARLGLAWYDYTEPQSLDRPELRNLEDLLASNRTFHRTESAKLYLLAAADSRRSLDQRQASFCAAVNILLHQAPTYTRLNQITASIVDFPEFDPSVRQYVLFTALVEYGAEDRKQDYRKWRAYDLCNQFNPVAKSSLALLDRIVAIDRSSPAAVLELATAFSGKDLSEFGVYVMDELFSDLLDAGDFPAAERFIALVPTWKLSSDPAGDTEAKRLEYLRRLRLARSIAVVHDQLVKVTTARYPTLATALPGVYADLRVRRGLPHAARADTRDACLYLIKVGQFNRTDLHFWGVLLRSVIYEPGVEKFADDLFAGAMHAAESDDLRAAVIDLFATGTDIDNPQIRTALERTISREVDPTRDPAAHVRARHWQLRVAERLDQITDVTAAFADLPADDAQLSRQLAALRIYTRHRDLPALRRTVEHADTSSLVSANNVISVLPALELLGLKDELAVERDVARATLKRTVAIAWISHNESSVRYALNLARLLRDRTLLPPEFVRELTTELSDPSLVADVALTDAYLRDDWPSLAKAAAQLNEITPTDYTFYWFRALAAAKLSDKSTALTALATYLQFSKDERTYPEALELQRQLESDAGTH